MPVMPAPQPCAPTPTLIHTHHDPHTDPHTCPPHDQMALRLYPRLKEGRRQCGSCLTALNTSTAFDMLHAHCAILPPANIFHVSVQARAFLSSSLSAASSVPSSAASSLTSDSCWRPGVQQPRARGSPCACRRVSMTLCDFPLRSCASLQRNAGMLLLALLLLPGSWVQECPR